jgi:hypothetical protein
MRTVQGLAETFGRIALQLNPEDIVYRGGFKIPGTSLWQMEGIILILATGTGGEIDP